MEWNIQQPNKTCTNCANQFKDNDPFHSFLKLNGDEVQREDFCAVCFDAVRAGHSTPPFDKLRAPLMAGSKNAGNEAYWKSRYRLILPPPRIDLIKKDKVEHLLRKYMAENSEEHGKVRYLLAVMLERKRVLKHLKTLTDEKTGNKILAYEHTKTAESFTIPDPSLSMGEIPALQKKVQELLDSDDAASEAGLKDA